MLAHNRALASWLAGHGVDRCTCKRIDSGSLRGSWRITRRRPDAKGRTAWDKIEDWTANDAARLSLLGLRNLRLKNLTQFDGNGGKWSLFVRIPADLLDSYWCDNTQTY